MLCGLRLIVAITCYVFCAAFATAAGLSDLNLTISASDDSAATRTILASLHEYFPTATVQTPAQIAATKLPPRTVHIAVGPTALKALSANSDAPIIAIYTSSAAYEKITSEAPARRRPSLTAIYAEPNPKDQFQLIRAIYKRPVPVAALIQSSSYIVPILQRAADDANIDLTIETVAPGETIFHALNRLASRPVLLAVPDPSIYNSETLRTLLMATYRREQALVGYSATFVNAGALATTTSDPNQIAAQLKELLRDYAETGRLPSEQFPKYFSVLVNDSVARSLNLIIDDSVRQLARNPKEKTP